MQERLDIVVTGFAEPHEIAAQRLARLFGIDAPTASRFVTALPQVAKRALSPSEAGRYIAALESIGARVELKPTGSLAVPAHDPTIPKAPRVPADLARMAGRPRLGEALRPDWLLSDTLEQLEQDDLSPRHTDAQLPPPLRTEEHRLSQRALHEPQTSDAELRAARSVKAVGLAHAATASIRPGMSGATWRSQERGPERADDAGRARRRRLRLGVGLVLLVLACAVALRLGLGEPSGASDPPALDAEADGPREPS
jgi:hypothetical protein